MEHLASPTALLLVDETGFVKKGPKSVGVKRQYSGTAGRIENCQVGVFLCYASSDGVVFIDRALHLPKEWAADAERRSEAGVPEETEFATKPELARQMLARALDARVPCAWVLGDSVYGTDRKLRMFLEHRKQPFVLGVPSNESLWVGGPTYYRASAITLPGVSDHRSIGREGVAAPLGRRGLEGTAPLRLGPIGVVALAMDQRRMRLGALPARVTLGL